jgi:gluconolactonase
MSRSPAVAVCLFLFSTTGFAESPVDKKSNLVEVSTTFGLCDGPAWDDRGTLYVPDVKGETLYQYNAKQDKLTPILKDTGRFSASFFNNGQLFLSDNGNARIVTLNGKELVEVAKLDDSEKPTKRPNDLVLDHSGGIYVTMTRQNQVYYISPEGKQSVAVDGIETPNGITLSPDEKTLYVSAYVPKQVWAYDVTAAGKTANGRQFSKMDDGPDKGADGMTIDRAGNVYCTGPVSVYIWSPSGELLEELKTPTRPINCAFGDQDMRSLYITCFGGLYKQRMKISGKSPNPPTDEKLQTGGESRPPTVIPKNVDAQLDLVYATYGDRELLLDLFTPKDVEGPKPAIVVVHGGGWLNGDKTKFRALAVELANRGYVTAAIEYRLAGEALFPAGIHDCNAAVRFLRAHAEKYEIDPQRIGAVGGSAGGHLVGLMATGWQNKELQGTGGWADRTSKLQAAIVMAGPMEMTTGSVAERSMTVPNQSNSNKWLGKNVEEAPELYALADAHLQISDKSSPILFMVGEHDNPQRNQPSRDKLSERGRWNGLKVYADGKHGCWNQLPWFNDMVDDMDRYFKWLLM